MILSLDISPKCTGWCLGNGATTPEAGAWPHDHHGVDYGALLVEFEGCVLGKIYTPAGYQRVTHVVLEKPILRDRDTLHTLMRIYGMAVFAEYLCKKRDIPCRAVDLRKVKNKLTGDPFASKDEMVKVALACGIALPATDVLGRKDAADGFAVWLWGIWEFFPEYMAHWDGIVLRARDNGALL